MAYQRSPQNQQTLNKALALFQSGRADKAEKLARGATHGRPVPSLWVSISWQVQHAPMLIGRRRAERVRNQFVVARNNASYGESGIC
jgi:hypothetical protein